MALSEGGALGRAPIIKELTRMTSFWKQRLRIQQRISEDRLLWNPFYPFLPFQSHGVQALIPPEFLQSLLIGLISSQARSAPSIVSSTLSPYDFPKYLFHQDPNYDPLKIFPWTSTLKRIKSNPLSPLILTLRTLHNLLLNYFSPHLSLPSTLFFHFFQAWPTCPVLGVCVSHSSCLEQLTLSVNDVPAPDPRHPLRPQLQRSLWTTTVLCTIALLSVPLVSHSAVHALVLISMSHGMRFTSPRSWRWRLFTSFSI